MQPNNRKRLRLYLTGLALIACAPASAQTDEAGKVPECFDAIVVARIVRQTPSMYSDCGPDCIIMTWPWFLQFDVKRGVVGTVNRGSLVALEMLHTSFRKNLGYRRWWLRRNSLGGFNVLRFGEQEKLIRCDANTLPAAALIVPGPGQTLQDLLREGERAYSQ